MFPALKKGEYEPNKVRRKLKQKKVEDTATEAAKVDSEVLPDTPIQSTVSIQHDVTEKKNEEEEIDHEEDFLSEDGAIYPIQSGMIVDWPCFYALMSHVYTSINPPFHTPVLLIAEPVWTPREHEKITQFFFERFKMPAFSIVDSAVATAYGYGLETATVIDIGKDKADVTAISVFAPQLIGRASSVADCGGEAMTRELLRRLTEKGFNRDMCEQLKKSSICEILVSEDDLPTSDVDTSNIHANHVNNHHDIKNNPAAAASTGGNEPTSTATMENTRIANENAGIDGKVDQLSTEDNDGVLDIASIVTGGKMNEFLEAKEKEKNEKLLAAAAKKKAGPNESITGPNASTSKVTKFLNSQKYKNTFVYEDFALHDALRDVQASGSQLADMQAAMTAPNDGETMKSSVEGVATATSPASLNHAIKRDIEVATERFLSLSESQLAILSSTIHRVITSVEDVASRPDLWNSLIIVGRGSKVKGFKEALLTRLQNQWQVWPSSATIFTSEIGSGVSTPAVNTGGTTTGITTPFSGIQQYNPNNNSSSSNNNPQQQNVQQQQQQQQQQQMMMQQSRSSEYRIAATTSNFLQQQQQQQIMQQQQQGIIPGQTIYSNNTANNNTNIENNLLHSHHHYQSPTSIKLAKIPEYFPEWKDVGYEEASFLGAQVAAKVLFTIDSGNNNKGYMTRVDYNDQGPVGIHDFSL